MTSQFEIDKQNASDATQVAENLEKLRHWLAVTYPGLVCAATEGALKGYLGDKLLTSLNEDDFALAFTLLKEKMNFNGKRVPTPAEVKAASIDEICELLRAPDPSGRGGRYSSFNIQSVRTKMQSWSIEALQTRKDEIIRAQALNEKPISELKQMVHDAQPQFGFPKLPRTFIDGMKSVPIDAMFLRRLPIWEFKKYVRLYGERAINARLAGEIK
jgi:hypothetical protein